MKSALSLPAALLFLLTACASSPPPPDWQASAFSALHDFSSAHLSGNTRLADVEFNRAREEISRTGQLNLMAKLELTRCATLAASLDWRPCTAFETYAKEASLEETAYARFLNGQWEGLDPKLLPLHYRALVLQSQAVSAQLTPSQSSSPSALLQKIQEPFPRLIAASVLLKRQQLQASEWPLAIDTSSAQGWRRPLLAWLGLALKSAQTVGNIEEAGTLQRRIDLVLQTKPKDQ